MKLGCSCDPQSLSPCGYRVRADLRAATAGRPLAAGAASAPAMQTPAITPYTINVPDAAPDPSLICAWLMTRFPDEIDRAGWDYGTDSGT